MPRCSYCGESADEDGYANCDCGKPRCYCPNCDESVLQDRMQESVGFDFRTYEFCDGCEENFYEQQDMWWWQIAEEYHDLLYEIHQTVEMLSKAKIYNH